MRTRFDSVAKIANYRGPLLQSHGIHDEIIPFQFGQRLYDAANRPKRLFPMPDRLHNDPPPPEYYDTLAEFLDQAAREDAAADTAKTGVQGGPQGRR
jgi:fermentation-respiration switch protein FrsA (DUF1100 family)